jgi:hypothetical protein
VVEGKGHDGGMVGNLVEATLTLIPLYHCIQSNHVSGFNGPSFGIPFYYIPPSGGLTRWRTRNISSNALISFAFPASYVRLS